MINNKYKAFLAWGFILVLLGVIFKLNISPYIENAFFKLVLEIISNIISSVGTALIIGYITSLVKISENIKDQLSKKGKQKVIMEILDLPDEMSKYKRDKVKSLMNMESEYRTNTVYNAEAFLEHGVVSVKTTMSYTEHNRNKNNKDGDKIFVRFDYDTSKINYIKISNPDNSNDSVLFTPDKIVYNQKEAHGDGLIYEGYCKIPKKYQDMPTLNIEKQYTFIGEDHWVSYGIILSHLTNGINFNLNYSKELTIKEVTIFGEENLYSKKQTSTYVNIKSTNWLPQYGGFLIIIGKK